MVLPNIGEVTLFAFNYAPEPWVSCAGQMLAIRGEDDGQGIISSLIGNRFGGDGVTTFALPDFADLAPDGPHYCVAGWGNYPTFGRGPALGEVTIFPYTPPKYFVNCDGQLLQVSEYESLFQLLGNRYGGDGVTTFGVPDMRLVPPLFPHGPENNQPEQGNAPVLPESMYSIGTLGYFHPQNPYLGEIKLFPWTVAQENWLACEGQLLPIKANLALFGLLGSTYGGDGMTNFAVPNLNNVPLPHGLQYFISTMGYFPARPQFD